MDEDYEYEAKPARLNWADVVFCMLAPWEGLFEGCTKGVKSLMGALALHSEDIGERQSFQRDAGRAIESLSRGEDG